MSQTDRPFPVGCADVKRLADRYVDRRVSAAIVESIERHLRGCAACRASVARAHSVRELLDAPDEARAPDTLLPAIMERVSAARGARHAGSPRELLPFAARAQYRRVGFACLASAALLAATLSVPQIAYPSLAHARFEASFGEGARSLFVDASAAARATLYPSPKTDQSGGS